MSMVTGGNFGNKMTGGMPSLSRGKSKGNLTPFSLQQFTPEQMQLFQGLFGHLGPDSFLSKLAGGDEGAFAQIEAPALRQFGELQGNLASRFSGMGSGARRSSGFQNTMSGAAGDFAQQLQSQRYGLQRQALQDLFGMSQQLLGQRPSENFVSEKAMPFWKRLLSGIAGPATQGAITGGMMRGVNKSQGSGFSQSDINNASFSMFPFIE